MTIDELYQEFDLIMSHSEGYKPAGFRYGRSDKVYNKILGFDIASNSFIITSQKQQRHYKRVNKWKIKSGTNVWLVGKRTKNFYRIERLEKQPEPKSNLQLFFEMFGGVTTNLAGREETINYFGV